MVGVGKAEFVGKAELDGKCSVGSVVIVNMLWASAEDVWASDALEVGGVGLKPNVEISVYGVEGWLGDGGDDGVQGFPE